MVCDGRSVGTLAKYRLPFLKLALWLAPPRFRAEPTAAAAGRYLALVTTDWRNASAAASAVAALQYVSWLNGWESVSDSVCLHAPLDAASRAFVRPTRNAPAFEAWVIVAIVQA